MQILTTHPSHHHHHPHHYLHHHHHHPHLPSAVMGTGRGSRSGSSSGSPPPAPTTDLKGHREGGEEEEGEEEEGEPADGYCPHPPNSSVSVAGSSSSVAAVSTSHFPAIPHAHSDHVSPAAGWSSPATDSSQDQAEHADSPGSSYHHHHSLSAAASSSNFHHHHHPSETSSSGVSPFPESGRPRSSSPGEASILTTHPRGSRADSGSVSDTQGPGSPAASHFEGKLSPPTHQTLESSTSSHVLAPGGSPEPPAGVSPQGGRLLDHGSLVAEEKLVAATLASLDQSGGGGDPSTIIKQDLRLIIQSRRKAEGKEELRVDFRAPPKEELTDEEWHRALKRRDQNRRAAQRFRHKQRQISTSLADRVKQLETAHAELLSELQTLESEKLSLLRVVYQHSQVCKDFDFKLKLQQALGYRLTSDPREWPS